ncbi:DUF1853 family protein [Vicingaceae bacterium]|nr:DUF1853 family protein [Vicingaceae bacterium]
MNSSLNYVAIIERVNEIESKFHRDLMALLSSPFVFKPLFPEKLLFNVHDFSNFEELWTWFKCIEGKPHPQDSQKLRLGKYAEELLNFYFENSTKYTLLSYNLQLIDDKLTVGEIDYLIQEKLTGYRIHLELAIKFFLKIKIENEYQWIGPSTKDNLTKKKNKLLNQQLKLVSNYNRLLPVEYQNNEFTPQLLLKGAEFISFEVYEVGKNPLKNAWWVHWEALKNVKQDNQLYTIIPNRKDWIFPFNKRLKRINFEQLNIEILEYLELQNEIMISRFQADGTPIDRGFIVRSNWPF